MEIKISDVIRNKRHGLGISQEVLAESLGVTVQAVSKWETGLSCPDIVMLPKIAEHFKISLDQLFFGDEREVMTDCLKGIHDDGKIRIVQCVGNKVLGKNEYREKDKIELIIPETNEKEICFEIWGSADIEGDVSGYVDAGAGVCCGNVGAHVDAGGGVNCGNVGAHVDAGGEVNCGNVDSYVNAGGNVKCGDVGGDVDAGHDVRCSEVNGNVSCNRNIIYTNK